MLLIAEGRRGLPTVLRLASADEELLPRYRVYRAEKEKTRAGCARCDESHSQGGR